MPGHIYKFKYKSEFLSFLNLGHFKELKSFKKLILFLFIYLSITIKCYYYYYHYYYYYYYLSSSSPHHHHHPEILGSGNHTCNFRNYNKRKNAPLKDSEAEVKCKENIQQLLDEAFLLSGIIKVEVSVISLAKDRGWSHLPRPWLFRISQKPNLIIVLLYAVLKKNKDKHTVTRLLLEIMHCVRNLQISQFSASR